MNLTLLTVNSPSEYETNALFRLLVSLGAVVDNSTVNRQQYVYVLNGLDDEFVYGEHDYKYVSVRRLIQSFIDIYRSQDMNFNTDSTWSSGFDKVPEVQLSNLLKRRGTTVVEPDDVEADRELKAYCLSRGIMGMNLGHMNPRAALQFLRNQLGDTSPIIKESKRGLLHG